MHPLAANPHVEMGKFPRRTGQDAGIARRGEAIQCLGRDLPNFAGSEDIFGLPALQRRQHVGRVAVEVDVNMGPFVGANLDGDLCARVLICVPQICCMPGSMATSLRMVLMVMA